MKLKFAILPTLLLTLLAQAETDGLRLIVVDPAHPHAAEIQVQPLPGFSNEVHVYAPLGTELTTYLNGIARYNQRPENPTQWALDIYSGPDFFARMLKEPPGNVVVLSGRNQRKMSDILASIQAGQHVLADKPWMIESSDLPKLEVALSLADEKRLIAYDCMTQRFDPAYQIQRELLKDKKGFGGSLPCTSDDPSVRVGSLAALLKRVTQRQPQSAGTSEPLTPASLSERARLAGLHVAGLEAREGQLEVSLQGPPAAVLSWLHALERDGGQVQRLQLQAVDEQLQVQLAMALAEG